MITKQLRVGLGYLSDFWSFNVSTGLWTWLGGSFSTNTLPGVYHGDDAWPGARSNAAMWMTTDSTIYLFGGYGIGNRTGNNILNDLWMYNTSSKSWKWESGAEVTTDPGVYPESIGGAGTPPARQSCAYWLAANGELFLFGGQCNFNHSIYSMSNF